MWWLSVWAAWGWMVGAGLGWLGWSGEGCKVYVVVCGVWMGGCECVQGGSVPLGRLVV